MSKKERVRQRKKIYELSEQRVNSAQRRTGPVGDILREQRLIEAEKLRDEADQLALEEIVAKRKLALRKAQSGVTPADATVKDRSALANSLMTNPLAQQEFLKLDEIQRAVLIGASRQLTASGTQSGGNLNAILPFMMMQMKQNPQTSVKDMVDLIKTVSPPKTGDDSKNLLDSMRLGFDMAMKNQPKGSESQFKAFIDLLKPLYDTLSIKDKELYNQQLSWYQGQIVSPTQQIKDVKEMANLLGFEQKGGSQMEATKMRIEHERWMAEQGWKREEWRDEMKLKREGEKSRWDAITNIGTKWMERVAPIIDAGIGAAQKRIQGVPGQPTTVPTTQPPQNITKIPPGTIPVVQNQTSVPCNSCGTVIPIEGNPTEITCPGCKTVFQKQPIQ